MKKLLVAIFSTLAFVAGGQQAFAATEEPTVYVIKKGDTLWGLSERFLQDPFFWPNLWATNSSRISNPHFIFPGQKLKIFPDRIEIEGSPVAGEAAVTSAPAAEKKTAEEGAPEKTYMVSGGEGFLLENDFSPSGFIVSTYQNRQVVGEDDIVYIDIGRIHGAKAGDRFSIFKKLDAISHPVTNVILGHKVIPLGTLQVSETEEKVSKAIITKSFLEIGPGSFLIPYKDRRSEIPLKSPEKDMAGYIVETKTGNATIAAGDIAYLDLGRSEGAEVGNMLYVVRDVASDQKFINAQIDKLPLEVIGAVVIVEAGEHTATALIIKSIDTIYRGDRVEIKKGK